MAEKGNQSFTELQIWKKARALKNEIALLVQSFPQEEKFRLSDQLIRSSRSTNANIAEGHGRYSFREQLHFCVMARGSLSETFNHLIDAFDAGYLNREQLIQLKGKIDEIGGLLNGYIAHLRRNIK